MQHLAQPGIYGLDGTPRSARWACLGHCKMGATSNFNELQICANIRTHCVSDGILGKII
jgi:hypothetical protein